MARCSVVGAVLESLPKSIVTVRVITKGEKR